MAGGTTIVDRLNKLSGKDATTIAKALENLEEGGGIGGFEIHICASGEYDAETKVPTIENPDSSTLYLVPTSEKSGDLFDEFIWTGEEWERFGAGNLEIPDPLMFSNENSYNIRIGSYLKRYPKYKGLESWYGQKTGPDTTKDYFLLAGGQPQISADLKYLWKRQLHQATGMSENVLLYLYDIPNSLFGVSFNSAASGPTNFYPIVPLNISEPFKYSSSYSTDSSNFGNIVAIVSGNGEPGYSSGIITRYGTKLESYETTRFYSKNSSDVTTTEVKGLTGLRFSFSTESKTPDLYLLKVDDTFKSNFNICFPLSAGNFDYYSSWQDNIRYVLLLNATELSNLGSFSGRRVSLIDKNKTPVH